MRAWERVLDALEDAKRREMSEAIWAGDTDLLNELAPCRCCCGEHTFESCEARLWGACRGQGSMTRAEEEGWFRFYQESRGMTWEQFYCFDGGRRSDADGRL